MVVQPQGVGTSVSRASAFPSNRAARSLPSEMTSSVGAENELARVQDERLLALRLEQLGQVVLSHSRVDVRVPVVGEDAEVPIEADVHAGGLHHRLVVRVQAHPALAQRGLEVPVAQQHARTLSTTYAGVRPASQPLLLASLAPGAPAPSSRGTERKLRSRVTSAMSTTRA